MFVPDAAQAFRNGAVRMEASLPTSSNPRDVVNTGVFFALADFCEHTPTSFDDAPALAALLSMPMLMMGFCEETWERVRNEHPLDRRRMAYDYALAKLMEVSLITG